MSSNAGTPAPAPTRRAPPRLPRLRNNLHLSPAERQALGLGGRFGSRGVYDLEKDGFRTGAPSWKEWGDELGTETRPERGWPKSSVEGCTGKVAWVDATEGGGGLVICPAERFLRFFHDRGDDPVRAKEDLMAEIEDHLRASERKVDPWPTSVDQGRWYTLSLTVDEGLKRRRERRNKYERENKRARRPTVLRGHDDGDEGDDDEGGGDEGDGDEDEAQQRSKRARVEREPTAGPSRSDRRGAVTRSAAAKGKGRRRETSSVQVQAPPARLVVREVAVQTELVLDWDSLCPKPVSPPPQIDPLVVPTGLDPLYANGWTWSQPADIFSSSWAMPSADPAVARQPTPGPSVPRRDDVGNPTVSFDPYSGLFAGTAPAVAQELPLPVEDTDALVRWFDEVGRYQLEGGQATTAQAGYAPAPAQPAASFNAGQPWTTGF